MVLSEGRYGFGNYRKPGPPPLVALPVPAFWRFP